MPTQPQPGAGMQGTFYFIQEDYRMVDYLRVGVITSPHGLRGDVKVFPTTDDVNRFKKLKKAYIDTGKEKMPVTVEQVRFFKNMVILKFKEMNRIEDCEPFRNKDILITRDQAVKLNPDENFIADLIGLKVLTDEGEEFGTVKDILQTAANDVYVIEGPEGKEYLFPSIKECILNVDLEAGTVTVHIMDGLLDL
jgi:16S rRNA processing protein RimM